MRRRELFAALMASGALLPSACSQERKPKATATILNNENVHRAMLALLGAVANLEAAIDGFSNTNWREVVLEVESAASEVSSATSSLRHELGYDVAS